MEDDEKEFMDIICRHRDMIWRICSTFRLSAAWTTEDAFHEVLCDLWKGFGCFNRRSAERTWIFRVATNTMLSLLRKKSNQPTTPPPPSAEPSYSEEEYRDVVDMLSTLSEPDSTIVRAHIQGFSYAEIGQMTGLSAPAVGMRLSRCLKKLKKLYHQ